MAQFHRVSSKYQITIPARLREELHIEAGDIVEFERQEDCLILKPKKLVDKSQAWFWTEEWQKAEREADEDLKAGRYKDFDSADKAIQWLKE
jgi:AbrB family looped-hinge helix DNA binding protein